MPERFEILTAGFYLFVQAWRRPLAFAWLVFWSIVLFSALFGGFVLAILPFEAVEFESGQPPPEHLVWMMALVPVLMAAFILAFLIFYTGWNRFLVGRKLPALIPFRLGADEGRSSIIGVVHMALAIGAYIVAVIPLMFIMLAAIIPYTFSGDPPPESAPFVSVLLFFVGYLLIMLVALAATVKLVPAYAMTIIERRIVIFDSWNATKGVFWSAFVAALIPLVFSLVIQLAGAVVQLVMLGASRLAGYPGGEIEPEDLSAYTDPALLIPLVIVLVITAVLWVVMMAMALGPYAYMAVWHDRNRQYREPQMAPLEPPASG